MRVGKFSTNALRRVAEMTGIDRRTFLQGIGRCRGLRCTSRKHQAGVGDCPQRRHRNDPGRAAHRHPDAGEPIVRSLFRHSPRSARLQRSARGQVVRNGELGVRAAESKLLGRDAVPADPIPLPSGRRTNLGLAFIGDLRPCLERCAPMLENGRYDKWTRAKGAGTRWNTCKRADIPYYYSLADAFTDLRRLLLLQ